METFGSSDWLFIYILLPSLIFIARVAEVSVNTIRIIYMLGGRRYTATVLGFFEALIWVIAMRQVFQHLDNWICLLMYAGGFAGGIFVGMIIEERIAYGKVIVRIITSHDIKNLVLFLNHSGFRHTRVNAEGRNGLENLIFTVLAREKLDSLLEKLKEILPTAFYTIEDVKAADENGLASQGKGIKLFTWLRGIIRH